LVLVALLALVGGVATLALAVSGAAALSMRKLSFADCGIQATSLLVSVAS